MGTGDDNQNSILKGILQNGASFNYPGSSLTSTPFPPFQNKKHNKSRLQNVIFVILFCSCEIWSGA